MYEEGYITGVVLIPIIGQSAKGVRITSYIRITPKGIEYLQDAEALAQEDNFKYYYKRLKKDAEGFDPNLYPQTIQKSNHGRNFVKDTNSDLRENWNYTQLKEIISKVVPVNI